MLIYKGTGVINFAMGEFMMLGAYFFYTANVMWRLPTLVALAITLVAVALVAAIERTVLRPLAGQPVISVLMATIGLASAVHGGVDAVSGGANLEMPALLPRKPFTVGEILVPGQVLWSCVLAAAIITAFTLYFRFSKTGVAMRAAASDPITAYVLGIDLRRTQALTRIFAGMVGAVAGILTVSRDVNDADLGLVTRHSVDDVCMVGPDKMLIKILGDAGHRERIAARLPESVQSQRLNSVYAARGRRRDAFHLRCGWKAREDPCSVSGGSAACTWRPGTEEASQECTLRPVSALSPLADADPRWG